MPLSDLMLKHAPPEMLLKIVNHFLSDREDRAHERKGGAEEIHPLPIENLLRFVTIVRSRIPRSPDDEITDPIPLDNLRGLISTIIEDAARALSSADKALLLNELMRIDFERSICGVQRGESRTVHWIQARTRTRHFLETAAVAQPRWRLQRLTRWIRYRSGADAIAYRPPDLDDAAASLTEILSDDDTVNSQPRFYLYVANALLALRRADGGAVKARAVVQAVRRHLAVAFARLPVSRALDRLGIAAVFYWHLRDLGAQRAAALFSFVASRILAERDRRGTRARNRLERSIRQVTEGMPLHDNPAPPAWSPEFPDLSDLRAALTPLIKTALATGNVSHIADALAKAKRETAGFEATLFMRALAQWTGGPSRSVNVWPEIDTFLDQAIMSERSDLKYLLQLYVTGHTGYWRGQDHIENVLRGFNSGLAILVLTGQFERLVEAFESKAHTEFLNKKLGFERETEHLHSLSKYFSNLVSYTPPPAQATTRRHSALVQLTGVPPSPGKDRQAVDDIQEHWARVSKENPLHNTAVEAWLSIREEAPGCGAVTREASLLAHMSIVRAFTATGFDTTEEIERAYRLATVGFCAVHFYRIARNAPKRNPVHADFRFWLESGTRWIQEAVDLSVRLNLKSQLYRALEAQARLAQASGDHRQAGECRIRQLPLDIQRFSTIADREHRHMAQIKAERTLAAALIKHFCNFARKGHPLSACADVFGPIQSVKASPLDLVEAATAAAATAPPTSYDPFDPSNPRIGDEAATSRTPASSGSLSRSDLELLAKHLTDHEAAILEFVCHPVSENIDTDNDAENQNIVCCVIRMRGGALEMRPFKLDATEASVRACAKAFNKKFHRPGEALQQRLRTDLNSLGEKLFPRALLAELETVKRLYLCPHRHLSRLPLHMMSPPHLAIPIVGRWAVSFAFRTQHIVDMLRAGQPLHLATFALLDNRSHDTRGILPHVDAPNEWGAPGLMPDGILKRASESGQNIWFCHGQRDGVRRSYDRLRLWGGGRLLAGDVEECTHDFRGSEFLIAACNAGATRVTRLMTPSIGLIFSLNGARRVTTCLYRVRPSLAAAFVSTFLRSGGSARYSSACRAAAGEDWRTAVPFVSYGLFEGQEK